MFLKLPFAASFSDQYIYVYIYVCVFAMKREFSEYKVLNIVNVELKQLKLHLLRTL